MLFFVSSRRRHTRWPRDWSSDVCSSDLRLLLVPLNVKQMKSTQAMQNIQPEIKELQEKHSSKDAETQKKLQEEQMALFQENGVNPIAGCLPIFIQMPVLIAMYQAIMRTEAIKAGSFLWLDRKSTRLNSSHVAISYAVFCLKKKNITR